MRNATLWAGGTKAFFLCLADTTGQPDLL
ncbi:hypothetical protein NPIL_254761, partial [Nephila pilipes]